METYIVAKTIIILINNSRFVDRYHRKGYLIVIIIMLRGN